MFEQAVFAVQNEPQFQQLASRIDAAFATNRADLFLASVAGKKLRVRVAWLGCAGVTQW